MKNLKKSVITVAIVAAIGITSLTAFAAPRFSIDQKKDALAKQVETGVITQERAEEIITAIEACPQECDTTECPQIGQSMNANFALGCGQGRNAGQGRGVRDGSCYFAQ